MSKLLFTLSFVLATLTVQAQTNLDSLYSVWQDKTQNDSIRVKAYKNYIWKGFLYSNPDTAFILAQSLLRFGEEHKYQKSKAIGYNTMGASCYLKSDFPKALDYFQRSLKVFEEIGDKHGISGISNNMGMIWNSQGENSKALGYYQSSLKSYKEIGDTKGSAGVINNIGSIYEQQKDFPKALEYYQRSLKVYEEIDNKSGSSSAIGNIGIIYYQQGNYPKALEYHQRSLKLKQEIGDIKGEATTINNIGSVYQMLEDYTKAMDYYQRSLKTRQEIGDKWGIANSFNNIGSIYKKQGNNSKAIKYCKKALISFQEMGVLGKEKIACKCVYDNYKAMGKGKEALVYLEKIQVIDDNLNAQETAKTLQQMEFSKQVYADSMSNAKKEQLVQKAHESEVNENNKTRNWLMVGGIFFVLLAVGFYGRWRFTKKAKTAVEHEKNRSDNLLLNILPADIAEELKTKGKADARDFDMVSILFTDFKGFTSASEKMNAKDLVVNINHCFEAFDGICEKYKVEKIKTIGDAYMAAGGLPVPTEDSIKNTVLAALEMQHFITQLHQEKEAKGEHAFEMRVGIHTGPVVAGIVGVKKFQYDIWGDTVNTAARMESSSVVEKVNISQSTYEFLKDDSDFTFESRGKIEAKGKGEIEMYFVKQSS